jgi:hypothetical protein
MAGRGPGHGNTMGPALEWDRPMAALINPIFLRRA